MEGESAVVVPSDFGLSMNRDPKAILAEGQRAAAALKAIIESKPKDKKVMMNGEQYLEFEDWQLVGTFYKCSARAISTEYIELGEAKGFLAKAEVVNVITGQVVSSAEAMCLNDEEKWSTRPKYEWKDVLDSEGKRIWIEASESDKAAGRKGRYKSEKVLAGTVSVPLFQLRSMAQTRACVKALRNTFAWVVVLAGYAPTPAEDMTGDENPATPAKPNIEPAKPKESGAAPSGDVISEAQGKRIFAIMKGANKTVEQVAAHIKTVYGYTNSREIKRSDYEAICTWVADPKAA